jgi:hypothetical protein
MGPQQQAGHLDPVTAQQLETDAALAAQLQAELNSPSTAAPSGLNTDSAAAAAAAAAAGDVDDVWQPGAGAGATSSSSSEGGTSSGTSYDEGDTAGDTGGGGGTKALAGFLLPADPSKLDAEVLSTLPQSVQLEVLERMRDAQQAGEWVGDEGRWVWLGDGLLCNHLSVNRRSSSTFIRLDSALWSCHTLNTHHPTPQCPPPPLVSHPANSQPRQVPGSSCGTGVLQCCADGHLPSSQRLPAAD